MFPSPMETATDAEEEARVSSSLPSDSGQLQSSSLFPLLPLANPHPPLRENPSPNAAPQWLCNTSFAADPSLINASATVSQPLDEDEPDGGSSDGHAKPKRAHSYEMLESSSDDDGQGRRKKEKRKRKKRRRRRSGEDSEMATDRGLGSRKASFRSWAGLGPQSKPSKEYYFDSTGDRDNLAFGCLYRMDVARYKLHNSRKHLLLDSKMYWQGNGASVLDRDADMDALDGKLKDGGRYWSSKYTAVERHHNLKRVRFLAHKMTPVITPPGDFIPLLDIGTFEVNDCKSSRESTVVEESWEDEVLCKTREFNRMSRERPQDEKVWLSFAEFQDKVASMQRLKGARLQTLEKKISILEKATELNPDNEELWLALLKAYQNRDSTDVLLNRWEKVLMQHSGSSKLWKMFLVVFQGEFSRFKVSDMRKMYAHAIQALSAACNTQHRQVKQTAGSLPSDPEIVKLELGLVDIFVSLCRFEWQAGYQELSTALFQGQIEYSLFCPNLLLTKQSRRRLFEYFWNSNGARIGEDGALGWSTWLEKDEANRQKSIHEEFSWENDNSGWTGWSEPLSVKKETNVDPLNVVNNHQNAEASEEEIETDDMELEDDTETLMKRLGINVDEEEFGDVKDTGTWIRWSKEEFSRDYEQWMPLHSKSADGEADEQLMRVVLFEDISEYLFSLSSREARFSLISQFIDLFGGKISQSFCTNSLTWKEKTLGSEVVPECILEELRRVHDLLIKTGSSLNSSSLEFLLGYSDVCPRIDMIKFLRNATLLSLTVFPRNYILQEAALVAEEASNANMKSNGCEVTSCRALAKCLLKSDRQDVLLCGVYAQREAIFGNIDHARKIYDMALLSAEGLPVDLKSNTTLLYFWYAELEFTISRGRSSDSLSRALHILCSLGCGTSYSPFERQPSSILLLRARQGFIDRMRVQQTAWARGTVEDYSIAFICSAALFEELTNGLAPAVDILTQAFSVVLPERRSQSYQLEFLCNYYVKVLYRHHKESKLSNVLECIVQGLQIYPLSPKILSILVEISHLYTVPNKLRRIFDDHFRKEPSVVVCLFAVLFEMCRGNSLHRIRGLFEKAVENEKLRNSVVLWRCFIEYELNISCSPSTAKRIFFRAIHACPWSKKLWLDGFLRLNSILTAKELSDLQEVMRDKELNLRTDVYEILLQDDIR